MTNYCRATTVSIWARRLAATLAVAVAIMSIGLAPATATDAPIMLARNDLATTTVAGAYMTPALSGEAAVGQTLEPRSWDVASGQQTYISLVRRRRFPAAELMAALWSSVRSILARRFW